MKIKSNASSAEITSPFYKINEDFCREFENYIASKNGKVKGKYNAWSYYIQGVDHSATVSRFCFFEESIKFPVEV